MILESVKYDRRAHQTLESCGFKKGGALGQAAFVYGRRWYHFHFDILRSEYLNMRMELLKRTLGDRLYEYLEKVLHNGMILAELFTEGHKWRNLG
ncbi:hypothetical protein GTO27_02445 [Candidatus Bathyarchaeota archaeon]|nr:hypothetical protein [Candidatus Bathyarchaeota archaeon]